MDSCHLPALLGFVSRIVVGAALKCYSFIWPGFPSVVEGAVSPVRPLWWNPNCTVCDVRGVLNWKGSLKDSFFISPDSQHWPTETAFKPEWVIVATPESACVMWSHTFVASVLVFLRFHRNGWDAACDSLLAPGIFWWNVIWQRFWLGCVRSLTWGRLIAVAASWLASLAVFLSVSAARNASLSLLLSASLAGGTELARA